MLATDAAAEGLNLGRYCNTVVNIDWPWTPGKREQRINRIHRIDGTHASYLAIDLTLAGTLERHLMHILTAKGEVEDMLLGEAKTRNITSSDARMKVKMVELALDDWRREHA